MVALNFLIDALQQIFRQCRVESHGLPQVRRHIEIHDGPDSAGIIGIRYVNVDFLRLRQGLVISDQPFKMQCQGFLNIFQRLGDTLPCGKAAWDIGNSHSVIRIGVFVQYDRKFHCASPLILERVKPIGYFNPACFRML